MTIPYHCRKGVFWSAWVEITVGPPGQRGHPLAVRKAALVDTGAEGTHLPDMLMFQLDLYPLEDAYMVGSGGETPCKIHVVSVEVHTPNGSIFHPVVRANTSIRQKWVLGMDVLAHYVSSFDGGGAHLTMTP